MADLKETINKDQIVGEYIGELAMFGNPLYSDDFYLLTGYKKRYQITAKEKGMIPSVGLSVETLKITDIFYVQGTGPGLQIIHVIQTAKSSIAPGGGKCLLCSRRLVRSGCLRSSLSTTGPDILKT